MSMHEHVRDAAAGALDAVSAESDVVKAAAVGGATASAAAIPGPPSQAVATLWYLLVGIWSVGDGNDSTAPDVIVTVFSSARAALIGLFVKSPGA